MISNIYLEERNKSKKNIFKLRWNKKILNNIWIIIIAIYKVLIRDVKFINFYLKWTIFIPSSLSFKDTI